MRKELKEFDWHIYGLGERDLDYTVKLVRDVEKAMKTTLEHKRKEIEKQCPPLISGEVMGDIGHYAWAQMQYLRHFCIWRLQGIFEGIITTVYLNLSRPPIGLKAKLDAMKEAGFTISQEKNNELLEWGKLRNALSHSPPEQHRPIIIEWSDIDEYVGLIRSVLEDWSGNGAN